MNHQRSFIAVLDDEANMRKALERLLRLSGYDVMLFEDGESLLRAPNLPAHDCIILDLHMPGLNGFSVLKDLSNRKLQTRVVVLTGHDEPGNEERVFNMGASAYLTKPVDESALLEAVGRCLAGQP